MESENSMLIDYHTPQPIHTYVREDIKDAQHINFDVLMESLLGLSPTRLKEWVAVIAQEKWHKDGVMAKTLDAYCTTRSATSRHAPFCNIVNRSLQMARGRLPGVPDVYPIDDICAQQNFPMAIHPVSVYGARGAIRKPDVVFSRGRHADKLTLHGRTDSVYSIPTAQQSAQGAQAIATAHYPTHVDASTATDNEENMIVIGQDEDSGKKLVVPLGLRWVDSIVNVGFSGKTRLSSMLRSFRQDRTRSTQTGTTCRMKADTRGRGRGQIRRTKFEVGQGPAGSSDPDIAIAQSPTSRKRHRGPDYDDILYHIHNSEPPSDDIWPWNSSDPDTFEQLSRRVKDKAIDLGSYALETLACTFGTRLHCVNMQIKNDRLYLWYYDACGFVYTESISVIEDFEKAIAVFVAIACCTPEQLGALPTDIVKP